MFIGGPVDGQWFDILNDPQTTWIWDEKMRHEFQYYRTEFINGDDRYRVFVLEGYDRTKAR